MRARAVWAYRVRHSRQGLHADGADLVLGKTPCFKVVDPGLLCSQSARPRVGSHVERDALVTRRAA